MRPFFRPARMLIGLIFLLACADKLFNAEAFAMVVANYRLAPDDLIGPIAAFLPWLELLVGLSLLTGLLWRGAAAIAFGLMLVFASSLGINLVRGLDIACGCFSTNPDAQPQMWTSLTRDAALLLATGWIAFRGLSNTAESCQDGDKD